MEIFMCINEKQMKAKYNIVLHYKSIPGMEMQFNVKSLLHMYNAQS